MVHDISDLVAAAAQDVPERRALVESSGRSITWQQLEDEVASISSGLAGVGVRAGQRVMLALGNRIEFVTSYLGVLRAQVVAVPVNPASPALDVARMIADSGSRLVIADEHSLPAVREAVAMLVTALEGPDAAQGVGLDADLVARAGRPIVVAIGTDPVPGEITFDDVHAASGAPVPALQDPEKLAALLYTSTPAGQRAAMVTHRALMANLRQAATIEPATMHGDDVVLGALPLFHVYGLNAVLGAVLYARARLVLVERWDPYAVLDLVEDEACSVLPVAPPVFAHWLRADHLKERLGPVRLVLSGSSTLEASVIAEFRERTGLEIQQGYGLTEASPVVTSTLGSPHPRPGSAGVPLEGVEVRVVDEAGGATTGEDPGEIEIRGDNLFSGYWPDGQDGPGADGWWRTGDVGWFDVGGDLVVLDKVEEVITVSGFSVYPSEVEEVLASVPGVTGVAVVAAEDAGTGHSVVAYVCAPGADPDALREQLAEAARSRLARFKQPSRVELTDELPRSASGGVHRGRLRGVERRRALEILP
ncbi:MAG: class I adenylate-forming enzyme family protein [Nocardioides sp.]|uniref:class I adenylate-forming enzyme family protein n=1 Tax=Nocardioides sp. TaxID=35761 RepID=UPI003EFCBBB4